MKNKKEDPEEVWYWTARKMSPRIILYIGIVFTIFIAVSYFGFHSLAAVNALVLAAIGYIVALLPSVLTRVEYRLTKQKLESRIIRKNEKKPYKSLFSLDQLSHVVKSHGGFKYYLKFQKKGAFDGFWKRHVSDEYSGEVKFEKEDAGKVMSILEEYEISIH